MLKVFPNWRSIIRCEFDRKGKSHGTETASRELFDQGRWRGRGILPLAVQHEAGAKLPGRAHHLAGLRWQSRVSDRWHNRVSHLSAGSRRRIPDQTESQSGRSRSHRVSYRRYRGLQGHAAREKYSIRRLRRLGDGWLVSDLPAGSRRHHRRSTPDRLQAACSVGHLHWSHTMRVGYLDQSKGSAMNNNKLTIAI